MMVVLSFGVPSANAEGGSIPIYITQHPQDIDVVFDDEVIVPSTYDEGIIGFSVLFIVCAIGLICASYIVNNNRKDEGEN